MAPNMHAIDRLEGVESRLKTIEKEFNDARRAAKRAKEQFEEVKEKRLELFNRAFNHIAEEIGKVYKELTRTASSPLEGQAYVYHFLNTNHPFTSTGSPAALISSHPSPNSSIFVPFFL
jgi:structural maintenance of chromosome 1